MLIPAPVQTRPVCIFDLDGTICRIEHRLHHIKAGPQPVGEEPFKADWDAFYEACDGDAPVWPVILIAQLCYKAGYAVYIVTGRSDKVATKTKKWLRDHDVPYHKLIMRTDGDFTPDLDLKKNWFEQEGLSPQHVAFVIEDRKQCVEMWRGLGLVCLQAKEGDY